MLIILLYFIAGTLPKESVFTIHLNMKANLVTCQYFVIIYISIMLETGIAQVSWAVSYGKELRKMQAMFFVLVICVASGDNFYNKEQT